MKNIKRAVSPVIAIVLMIALTVAGAAIIWVATNSLLNSDTNLEVISIKSMKDYNNDGKADYMVIEIKNFGDSGNLSYVSIFDNNTMKAWYLSPSHEKSIFFETQESKLITIYTNVSSYQVSPKTKVIFALGLSETQSSLTNMDLLAIAIVQSPLIVSVVSGDGTPVQGVSIFFTTTSGLPSPFPVTATDINGKVMAYIIPDSYIARTTGSLSSDVFHRLLNNSITLTEESVTFDVTLQDTLGNPIVGASIFNADTSFNDLGTVAVTNATGQIEMTMGQGKYLFRAEYLGSNYWSSEVQVPLPIGETNHVVIKISGGDLIGRAVFGEDGVGSGKLLRLFNSNNQSLGRYDYTNTTSYFEFLGVASGIYRLRLDYQGFRYWSPLISTSDANPSVNFGGGKLNVLVTAGGSPLPNGVLTRLFHENNASAGSYDYLNATGFAEYNTRPSGSYRLRIDWLGKRTYTAAFTHNDGSLKTVDIGGGKLNILVTAGGSPLPNGVLTRLFNSDGTSAGRYDYLNATGFAEYGTILPGTYKLRIDWLGQRLFTSNFTHSDTSPQYLDLAGGKLVIAVQGGGSPLPNGVLTRLFNADNSSAGRYDYLNATGFAEYGTILPGIYRLRVDWLGQRIFTTTFNHSDGSSFVIDVGGGALNIKVTAGGSPLPNGVLTRLFNADNSSAGRYDYLNATGFAEYGTILPGTYRLRIDWLGQRVFTTTFNHTDSTAKILEISGGVLTIKLTAGGDPLPNGVLTRLFNADNSSAGRYDYLNATGFAEYGVILPGTYRLRIDWLGLRIFTTVFIHGNSTSKNVDVPGGDMNYKVTIGGQPLPNGVLVRLYNADNSSTGRYDYTFGGDGSVQFLGIVQSNFRFRVDWGSQLTFSSSFLHTGVNSTINLAGTGIMVLTIAGIGSGVIVRLYLGATSSNTGRYAYTDTNQQVTFNAVVDNVYMIRLGSANYSDTFYNAPSVNITFGVGGVLGFLDKPVFQLAIVDRRD